MRLVWDSCNFKGYYTQFSFFLEYTSLSLASTELRYTCHPTWEISLLPIFEVLYTSCCSPRPSPRPKRKVVLQTTDKLPISTSTSPQLKQLHTDNLFIYFELNLRLIIRKDDLKTQVKQHGFFHIRRASRSRTISCSEPKTSLL